MTTNLLGMASPPRGRGRDWSQGRRLRRSCLASRRVGTGCHASRPRTKTWFSTLLESSLEVLGSKVPVVALCVCLQLPLAVASPAHAILKGNPNAKIPRNAEAALRRSTPVVNSEMAEIQKLLEDVASLLRIPQRKQWDKMGQKLTECRDKVRNPSVMEAILKDVTAGEEAQRQVRENIESMDVAFGQVLRGIEYKDATYSTKYLSVALSNVNTVELAQVRGLPYSLPRDLVAKYPVLTGRAQVRLTIRKKAGSPKLYVLDEETRQDSVGTVTIDLDGFSAPVTSGQLLTNIKSRKYDGIEILQDLNGTALIMNAKKGAFAQASEAEGAAEMDGGEPASSGEFVPKTLPLEIFQTGEFEPFYNQQLDVLEMEYPILPMSVFGAVVMSHDSADANKSSTENFFIYKFDESMGGLAGLSFDEGQFSVVGYVTSGADLVAQVEGGDVIEKVEILSGGDRLRRPGA
uniref:PPIase cyclophilin-type domain-containing protein n=2 Tax=Chloropicon primus TaxID=1764295 RepID=A0A7S2SZM0_9CHLO|mmetsp:Transcript_14328/g.40746  ORF Transcript_14328/g.40746 Transcript_14328/m.40746 type:complete len:462 (+) Transcript_14328:390-1775(+)